MTNKLICVVLMLFCCSAVRAQTTAQPTTTQVTAETKTPAAGATERLPDVAAENKKKPVRMSRFEKPPVIDGLLDEDVWKTAAVLEDFYQIQPGDNIAPSVLTKVMIGYDKEHLYIGFHAYDEPGKVRSTVAKRDDVLADDNVRIYLDTFRDQRKSYVFAFNPFGVQQDGILTEGGAENYSVDIVMESKGRLVADGYIVEVAIPFKSLRYLAGKDQLWGVQILRNIKHLNDEQNSWQPILRERSGFLTQAGYITGFDELSGARTLELIPSLTLSQTGKRVRNLPLAAPGIDLLDAGPDRFSNKGLKFDPGLTGRLGITPTITLDFALNPDFAQVEADQLVITANQRFPIFFEEKRPFFLEGFDIFTTPLNALNTRAIIDPDAAVKLTGKIGRNTFGVLLASDPAPGNFTEEEQADPAIRARFGDLFGKSTYIGVLRLKRDIGKENNLGLIGTTYNFKGRHNHLLGLDGRFRLDPKTALQFQVAGTTTRGTFRDADLGRNVYRTGNGLGYVLRVDSNGRNWKLSYSGTGRSPDYRADVGFTRRVDTNNQSLRTQYLSDPKPKARLISWSLINITQTNFDWKGRSQLHNTNTQVNFSFPRQGYLALGYQKGYERLFEEEFGPGRTATRGGTFLGNDPERSVPRQIYYGFAGLTPNKSYSFDTEVVYTVGAFDFDFGNLPRYPRVSPAALLDPDAPLDPGSGNELTIFSTFIYKPTETLRLSLNYTKDRLVRDDTGRVAFDANLFELRGTYQFSRFTFMRARVDYDTLAANVRGQLLLGWTPSPGTSFYAGYNDDANFNGFNPFNDLREPGFRRNGRTFFVKVSYLFGYTR